MLGKNLKIFCVFFGHEYHTNCVRFSHEYDASDRIMDDWANILSPDLHTYVSILKYGGGTFYHASTIRSFSRVLLMSIVTLVGLSREWKRACVLVILNPPPNSMSLYYDHCTFFSVYLFCNTLLNGNSCPGLLNCMTTRLSTVCHLKFEVKRSHNKCHVIYMTHSVVVARCEGFMQITV